MYRDGKADGDVVVYLTKLIAEAQVKDNAQKHGH